MAGCCIKKDARYKQVRVVDANNVYWNRRFFLIYWWANQGDNAQNRFGNPVLQG